MADDVRLDLRGRLDSREVGGLFSSGLVLMASQTNPLEVVVVITSAPSERDDVIDLEGLGLVADATDRIPCKNLRAKFHPSAPAVRSSALILPRIWPSVSFSERDQPTVSGYASNHFLLRRDG